MNKDHKNNEKLGLYLEYEQFLFSLIQKLINIDSAKIDDFIENSLKQIADLLNADRSYIYFFKDNNKRLILSHQYSPKEIKKKIPQHEGVDKDDFLWLNNSILRNDSINIISINDLPPKASTLKVIMEVESTKCMILSPIVLKDTVIGLIGLDKVNEKNPFSDDIQYLLKKSGGVFAESIIRKNKAQTGILSEQKYRNLFLNVEDGVFISTPEGKFLDINNAGAQLFGYSSIKEMFNIDIGKDLYLNAGDREEYIKKLNLHGHIKDYELMLKRKDGKTITVLETAVAIRNDNGDAVAIQGIVHDITMRRKMEQQLFQMQKLESIGLLAGGVSHDFNNILTTISGYAELVRMDLDTSDRHYNNIKNIIHGCKRAETLIRKLLAFSRRQMIEPKIVNINKVITELHTMLTRLIAEDIRFELKLNKNLSNIKADPGQIQQILVNLVVNASHAIKLRAHHSQKGLIRIITDEVTLTEKFITQHPGSRRGKFVVIEVHDSGIGMDEKTKLKIFEPFFTTKKEGEGTGLGLSIVYGIVKQNNSNIYVESQPGKGSIFRVYWPSTDKGKTDESKIESPVQYKKRSGTILVVEDDFHVREFISNALKSLGYSIIEAENGQHALKTIKVNNLSDKIDLVISDIVMPEMGGEELADNIHQLNPSIKVILCSGYSDSRISGKDKYNKHGYIFLSKPYTIKKLETTIRSLLQNT